MVFCLRLHHRVHPHLQHHSLVHWSKNRSRMKPAHLSDSETSREDHSWSLLDQIPLAWGCGPSGPKPNTLTPSQFPLKLDPLCIHASAIFLSTVKEYAPVLFFAHYRCGHISIIGLESDYVFVFTLILHSSRIIKDITVCTSGSDRDIFGWILQQSVGFEDDPIWTFVLCRIVIRVQKQNISALWSLPAEYVKPYWSHAPAISLNYCNNQIEGKERLRWLD